MLQYRHPDDRREEGFQQKVNNVGNNEFGSTLLEFRNAAALGSRPPRLPDMKLGALLSNPQAVPSTKALDPSFDLKYRVINYFWAYMFFHYIAAKRAVGSSG